MDLGEYNSFRNKLKGTDIGEILNEVPGGIAVYLVGEKVETLTYSQGLPKMQGYTREEYEAIIEADIINTVYEEDHPLLKEAILMAVKNCDELHVSYRVYCKNGEIIWVNLSAYPSGYSEEGKPIYYAIFSNSTMQFNLYRDVCDKSSIGILVIDAVSGDVYYVNQSMLDMTDSSREHVTKTTAQKLFRSTMTETEKKMICQEESEFIHVLSSGKRVMHLYTRKMNWMNHPSILIYATDITDEYQKQEKLQQRYENQVSYSRMLSASSIASSMVNLSKNCITLQDTENAEIMDVMTRQTPQEGFESMYPHILDETIRKKYAAVFDTQTIINNFEKGITENRIRHPYDSFDYWMESSYNAIRNPKTGDLEVYCFAKDVTEEILQQDVSNALMVNEYDDVVLIHTQGGTVSKLIESIDLQIYGGDEEYEKPLVDFLQSHSADENLKMIIESLRLKTVVEALQRQKIYAVSFSLYNREQKIIRKRVTFSYLNQYRTTILCTTQDITSDFENEISQRESLQAALKQAQAATKAKSVFLSNMSHDMRTPMNAIIGLSKLGMELNTVDELKKYLQDISFSANQLLDLINDTLDISRIENGKLTLNLEYIMSSQMMLEAVSASRVIAEQKGVHFVIVKDGMLDRMLYVDKGKIVKIFNNILSNAVKFTPAGGTVTFTVKRLSQTGMDANYKITVKDTGIGISDEFQKHIYEPFAQEHREYSSNIKGTGLGMTIAKEIVEFLGGKVVIESEPNRGTEVTVWISFRIAEENPLDVQREDVSGCLKGKHILLVEDHSLNAAIASKILEKAECLVTWAKDGEECCNIFTSYEPGYFDCVLMDIRMPVLNGLEATRRLRKLEREDARKIPVIAMSANAYEEDIRESLAAGMNAHIAKPINAAAVYETIAKYLG